MTTKLFLNRCIKRISTFRAKPLCRKVVVFIRGNTRTSRDKMNANQMDLITKCKQKCKSDRIPLYEAQQPTCCQIVDNDSCFR